MSRSAASKRHIIWSNIDLDVDDWRQELLDENPDLSEEELIQQMYDTNDGYLDDERENLDIPMPQEILIIADLGLWNGRKTGYKEIKSGNIKDCLYSDTDYTEWYVDQYGDLRADAYHHDGINHYLYRTYKESVSDTQKENLKYKIFTERATRADINRLTNRLGDEIGKVYGWDFPQHTKKKERGDR